MNETDAHSSSDAAGSVVPDGIRRLLDQRHTYEEWLSRLDEVGDQYRAEVAERVRRDYRERLDGVANELEGHRADLESALEQRRDRLGELAEGFEKRSAELEEAELRFQVGEFDEGTWAEHREELTTGLEDIEEELDGARRAVEELEGVLHRLGQGGPAAGAAKPRSSPAPESRAHSASAERVPEEIAADGRDGPEAAGAGETADPEEEADVLPLHPEVEVDEEAVPEADGGTDTADGDTDDGGSGVAAVATADRAQSGESDDYLDELEFLESLSLDDPDTFDAVSRMLDDEEDR